MHVDVGAKVDGTADVDIWGKSALRTMQGELTVAVHYATDTDFYVHGEITGKGLRIEVKDGTSVNLGDVMSVHMECDRFGIGYRKTDEICHPNVHLKSAKGPINLTLTVTLANESR